MGKIVDMFDSLSNVLSMMGWGGKGQAVSALPSYVQATLETNYRTSWLCRQIHDVPPYDMTREWRNWQADKDKIELIEAEERRLGVRQKVRKAMTLARLHGGAGLILGLPGNSTQAIDPESVKKDGLGFVHVVNRYQLRIQELEQDPLSPLFGQPKMYFMNSAGKPEVEIHPTRVIPFIGQEIPVGAIGSTVENFWGDPLLMVLESAINNSDKAQTAIADLLDEAKLDIITIPNLMEQVGTEEYERKLLKRLTVAQGFKGMANALLISGANGPNDPGEEWEQRQIDFDGLPDLAQMFLAVAAGAADIPATRLLGKSPDGMNASGDGDLRNYYDMLGSRQSGDLQPVLDPLDEMLIRSALGDRPEDIFYLWASLWKMPPETAATMHKIKAEAVGIYADRGLLPAQALEQGVQNMLIEDGLLPGLEAALEEMPEDERLPSLSGENEEDPALVAANDPAAAPGEDPTAVGNEEPGGKPPKRKAANDRVRQVRALLDAGEVNGATAAILLDATPRTLYVSRSVANFAAIVKHFAEQGIIVDEDPLHVTEAYSRTPLDWMTVAAEWSREPNGMLIVPAGGPRVVERLGDGGAIVQLFNENQLVWRHEEIKRAGATWDYPSYQPHFTLTYDPEHKIDVEAIKPWTGAIHLGPEIFEEIRTEGDA